jgi:hypothetical protein
MKIALLEFGVFVLLFALTGIGCEKKEDIAFEENIRIKDVSAELSNNDWQNLPSEKLIWYFIVDETKMKRIHPYLNNYLIPVALSDSYKIKGLKVQMSGNVLLNELSSIANPEPGIRMMGSYKFEITEINKIN